MKRNILRDKLREIFLKSVSMDVAAVPSDVVALLLNMGKLLRDQSDMDFLTAISAAVSTMPRNTRAGYKDLLVRIVSILQSVDVALLPENQSHLLVLFLHFVTSIPEKTFWWHG
jgi:hypothetical protein